jgi:hypothetical protein
MVKTAGRYLVHIKSYSKTGHGHLTLKCIIHLVLQIRRSSTALYPIVRDGNYFIDFRNRCHVRNSSNPISQETEIFVSMISQDAFLIKGSTGLLEQENLQYIPVFLLEKRIT